MRDRTVCAIVDSDDYDILEGCEVGSIICGMGPIPKIQPSAINPEHNRAAAFWRRRRRNIDIQIQAVFALLRWWSVEKPQGQAFGRLWDYLLSAVERLT